jgi:hypothetical protein
VTALDYLRAVDYLPMVAASIGGLVWVAIAPWIFGVVYDLGGE